MLKKLLFLALLISTHLSAEILLKGRVGAFFPSSSTFREIYGQTEIIYEIEGDIIFRRYLAGFVNFDWLGENGNSIGLGSPTRIEIATFSAGLKIPYAFNRRFLVAAGLGPTFTEVWISNRSICLDERVSQFSVGVVGKGELLFFITPRFFADAFVDYVYQPVPFQNCNNIGGARVGGGLGVRF